MQLTQAQRVELMFYTELGRLLTDTHKPLHAMVCRKFYHKLTELGVTLRLVKSMPLPQ